jgi:lipoprotein-releasing system ATP-binding protein
MDLIVVKNVKRSFQKLEVIRGVNFVLEKEAQYVLVGASGSGKSTLLYLLGGLDKPSSGSIMVDGKNLSNLSDKELAAYRNQSVGFVFQNHFLLGSMTCEDNILLPARIGGASLKEVKERIRHLAQKIGVEHCLAKFPYEISGGEGQRINIIRALSLKPKLLLCDEPTGNLDSENTQKVMELLRFLASEFAATLVVVTHDEKVASSFERRLHIRDGLLLA